VLYADDQYDSVQYKRYHDDAELAWVLARSLVHDDEVWVPAMAVFMDYPAQNPDEYLFPITSNGLAAGTTLHSAVLSGLLEVLERDALLISWLNRLPGHPHDPLLHPDESVRRLARLYRRRGVELVLIELPADHPVSVFMGIARSASPDNGPSAAVGLGADLNPLESARRAVLEVGQVRPSIRRRARIVSAERVAELAADPVKVTAMEDHALLYAHPSTAHAFDFLLGEPRPWRDTPILDSGTALRRIVQHFGEVGQEVLYANLTSPDMQALGIFTARVIVPGFQPIWFGEAERRLGGRRMFEFAFRNGLRETVTEANALNPMPHPLA
jgi:ribosomal protein S12 methylthiotransferase accessory factor